MPGSTPARRLSRRRRSLDPETMIVDLMRDTVGENDENARRRTVGVSGASIRAGRDDARSRLFSRAKLSRYPSRVR